MNKGSIIIKLSMILFSTIGLWQYYHCFVQICQNLFQTKILHNYKKKLLYNHIPTQRSKIENNYPI